MSGQRSAGTPFTPQPAYGPPLPWEWAKTLAVCAGGLAVLAGIGLTCWQLGT